MSTSFSVDFRSTARGIPALAALEAALKKGCENLFSQQHADGYWWYTLEANDTINAEYILLLKYLGIVEKQNEAALCRWLLQNQNDDGSWSLFYKGPGDLSTTVECYLALKMADYDVAHPAMAQARAFILAQGGITKIRIFSRIHLALFGLVSWDVCPKMPIAFIQLPEWAPVNIYEFSSWARACIVPLLVVMDMKKVSPTSVTLDELYCGDPRNARWAYPTSNGTLSIENAFIQIDRALQIAEKLNIKPLRKASRKKCEKYIREHLSETEDIYPAMFYGILALSSMGYALTDPHIEKALAGLKSFHVAMSEPQDLIAVPFQDDAHGSAVQKPAASAAEPLLYQQCCISPVWDTAWAGVALLDADVCSDHPELLKAARWLIAQQITDVKGDWSVKNPTGEAGGWSFEFQNKYYPDVDDTIEVLTMLHRVDLPYRELKKPFERGLNWLLSMQCSNGGFAAFDKDNDLELLNKIPFSDHGACLDPPTADITGRMIEFLIKEVDFDKNHPVIRRAADFIVSKQSKDGSFWGRWGVNYVYGTWGALSGLCALGRPQDRLVIARAIKWLKSVQNSDGGFGESCLSYSENRFIPTGESVASQTAWALLTFVAAGEERSSEAEAAAGFLERTQAPSGTWQEKYFTGTGFPGHFYIRYHGYRNFFPVMALGQYLKKLS